MYKLEKATTEFIFLHFFSSLQIKSWNFILFHSFSEKQSANACIKYTKNIKKY